MAAMVFHRFAQHALIIDNTQEERVLEEFCPTREDAKCIWRWGRIWHWWKL